ncbi:hypothetical protein E2320_017292 [Naja naja]|nr:hypothetical protein E2320_017292 [Naja naja]
MAALRSAALHCGFRDLDDMLLVCGIRDLYLQRHLLAKADLSQKAAIKEAQAVEMSTLSAAEIQGSSSCMDRRINAAVHYEEAICKDFYDEEEEINCLKGPQQAQRRNNPAETRQITPQVICLSCGGYHPSATCHFRNMIYRERTI